MPRLRGSRRRLAAPTEPERRSYVLSVVDHAASAASNAFIVLAVARWQGLQQAGDFAVAYSFFLLALGLCRAYHGEAVLQLRAEAALAALRSPGRTAQALMTFLLAGGALFAASRAFDGEIAGYLVTFAVGAPLLLLQDYQRYLLFRFRRYGWAVASDSLWFAVSATAYLFAPDLPGDLATIWVAGGCVSLLLTTLGVARLVHGQPSISEDAAGTAPPPNAWRRALFGNFLITQGSMQAVTLITAAVAGATAVGALRTVATPYGLLFVLYVGTGVAVLTAPTAPSFRRMLWIFLGAAVVLAVALELTPDRLGQVLVGADGWRSVQRLNLPIAASLVGQGWVYAAMLLWRRLGHVGHFVRLRVFTNLAPLAGAYFGASYDGAFGAAVGLAVAHLFGGAMALALSYRWLGAHTPSVGAPVDEESAQEGGTRLGQ